MNLKIGNTPLIELTKEIRGLTYGSRIFAKLETENVGGSIKDRVALAIVEDAEERGRLKAGGKIVESTSGNTGVGLALVAQAKGYKSVIFMPKNTAQSVAARIRACGGAVVFTDENAGMQGSVNAARAFVEKHPNAYYADQFNNPVCVAAHYRTTGREIWRQTGGKADIFVAGIGTGGTLTGTAKYLKEKNPAAKAVGVEPSSSPLLSQGWFGKHDIQGIGANFIPPLLDRELCDEVLTATETDASFWAAWVYKTYKIAVGLSSGAALSACLRLAKRKQNAGKNIVTIFQCDGGRYALK